MLLVLVGLMLLLKMEKRLRLEPVVVGGWQWRALSLANIHERPRVCRMRVTACSGPPSVNIINRKVDIPPPAVSGHRLMRHVVSVLGIHKDVLVCTVKLVSILM
jgi:hypothetical protein